MSLRNRIKQIHPATLIALLLLVAVAIFHISFRQVMRVQPDEGMLLDAAMKVSRGQVMYRDFFEFWTPGTVYVVGLLFKIFGLYWWVDRAVFIVSAITFLGLGLLVVRQARFSPFQQLASLVLAILATQMLYTVSHHWFGQIGLLATLYVALRYQHAQHHRQRIALIAGICAGLTAVFMQYEGMAAMVAGLISLLYLVPRQQRLITIAAYGAGILVVALPLLGYFTAQGALSDLLYSTIMFPVFQYGSVNVGVASPFWGFQSMLLFLMYWYYRSRPLPQEIRVIMIFAVLMQVVGFTTRGEFQPLFAGTLISALAVYWASEIKTVKASRQACIDFFMQPIQKFVQAFAIIFFSCLYVIALCSLVVTGWTTLSGFKGHYQTVDLPVGKVQVEPLVAQRMAAIQQALAEPLGSKEPIYFGPYISYYYFIYHATNPTALSQITPKYNPDWMISGATDELEDQHVNYVVLIPNDSPFAFTKDNLLYQYVSEHFQPVVDLPKVEDYEPEVKVRKSQDAPNQIWVRKQ